MIADNEMDDDIQTSTVAILVVITLLVAIRIAVRQRRNGLGWDDVCIVFSWICTVSFGATVFCAAKLGFGRHIQNVPPEHLPAILLYILASVIVWTWGVCAAKASFACFYLRIISDQRWTLVNRLVILCLFCQGVEQCLYEVLQCRPIHKAWNPDAEGTCVSLLPLWWVGFALNLGLDLILFIEPIPIVWNLQQMPATKKIGVIFMLSLGLLVCAIAVIRIVQANKTGPDLTYDLAEPMLWSLAEVSALIICSCIPTMRQAAQYVPWLSKLLGLPPTKSGGTGSSQIRGGLEQQQHHEQSTAAASEAARERQRSRWLQRQRQRLGGGSGTTTNQFLARHLHSTGLFGSNSGAVRTAVGASAATAVGRDAENAYGEGLDIESAAAAGPETRGGGMEQDHRHRASGSAPWRFGLTSHISSAGRSQNDEKDPHDLHPQDPSASSSAAVAAAGIPLPTTPTRQGESSDSAKTTMSVAKLCSSCCGGGVGTDGQSSRILVTLEIDHDVEEIREQRRLEDRSLAARHGLIIPEGWAAATLPPGVASASTMSGSPAKLKRSVERNEPEVKAARQK